MFRFLCRRFLSVIPTLLVCSILVFFTLSLIPGDPLDHLLGERGANPELKQEMMIKWGLDQALYKQYFIFISRILKGDLGHSLVSGRPVWEEFKARFPATVELSSFALLFSLLLGIPLGFLSALKAGSIWDFICSGFSLMAYSLSVFWWGLILILFFSLYLGLTPVSGRIDVLYDIEPVTGFMLIDSWYSSDGFLAFKSALKHLILPVLTLGTIPLAYITRIVRFTVLEVLKEDFIRGAKAKGLSLYSLCFVHVFRNVLVSLITVTGLMLGALLAGAVLTETVFSWPGIGRWLTLSVLARDYPVLKGGILLSAGIVVLINFLVDGLYYLVDPRVRSVLE